ncbi:MAG: hypothetical protein JSV79_04155 [Armatimonadota bacterium]|nr:MAG: hypothetical protein JSV79_04155 [Armatimonadota bacterium]
MECHEVTELARSDKALAPAAAEAGGVVSVHVEAGAAWVASRWDLAAPACAQVAAML